MKDESWLPHILELVYLYKLTIWYVNHVCNYPEYENTFAWKI